MPRNFLAFVDLFAHDPETFASVTQHEVEVCISIVGPTKRALCLDLDRHIEIVDLEPGDTYRMSAWLQHKEAKGVPVSPNCSVSFRVGEEKVGQGKHAGAVQASGPAYIPREGDAEIQANSGGRFSIEIDTHGRALDESEELVLVVGVKTAASAFEARAAIRETWGADKGTGSEIYFIVGKPSGHDKDTL